MVPELLSTLVFAAASLLPVNTENAHTVRSLSPQAVKAGTRVHLSGTVTFSTHPHNTFYFQDDTAGIRIEWPSANRHLVPGDHVEVWGIAASGTFLTEVRADYVYVDPKKRDAYPEPQPYNLTLDDSAYADAQWVETEVVVQRAWTIENWLQLDIARGRGNAVVMIPIPLFDKVQEAEKLRGAVVKVLGVCRSGLNASRQATGPVRIYVTNLEHIRVTKAPPADQFALPVTPASAVSLFRANPLDARMLLRVNGVVTLDQSGRQLYLQDEQTVTQVYYINGAKVRPGQRVTVVGFPRLGTDPPRLDNAHVRVVDTAEDALPAPQQGTVAAAKAGKLDGRRVVFTGKVLDTLKQGDYVTANLVVDGVTILVVFLDPDANIEPGSTLEVTGVFTRQQLDKLRPHSYAMIVRFDDFRVLELPPRAPEPPSWWTGRRVAYLFVGVFGLFLAGGAGATALRIQTRRAIALAHKRDEENQRLESQLKLAANLETAGRLVGSIAHDFNNALMVINGCAFLLDNEKANDQPRIAKLAETIRRAGDDAAQLTKQLKLFSRQESEQPYPVDLNQALTDMTMVLNRLLGDRVVIRLTTTPGLPLILSDTAQLSRILLNLAVNAVDAMPNGGALTLAATMPETGWVRLTVTDTGIGMTDEVKSHIFERGFTTKPIDKGTGLGLATVAQIVAKLKGRIRFHSELGRGTTFEIDWPVMNGDQNATIMPAKAMTMDTATTAIVRSSTLPKAMVLLVEDEESVRNFLRQVLELAGLTVFSASDPSEALGLLSQYRGSLDLLITDVMLPGFSGRQLAECVRALHPAVKVLYMSGYTQDEVLLQGIREEQVDFLHKPFLPREMLAILSRLLTKPTS
jgi:signal transduction histidine kinase/CheY-like chemotaxis protein